MEEVADIPSIKENGSQTKVCTAAPKLEICTGLDNISKQINDLEAEMKTDFSTFTEELRKEVKVNLD